MSSDETNSENLKYASTAYARTLSAINATVIPLQRASFAAGTANRLDIDSATAHLTAAQKRFEAVIKRINNTTDLTQHDN